VCGWLGGWVDGWMGGRVVGWMCGWKDGWMGGWVDDVKQVNVENSNDYMFSSSCTCKF